MPVPSKPSNAPGTSLSYITIGAILAVLAGTSFFFFQGSSEHPILGYLRTCSLILGIVLLAIGFGVGHIGRVAREAEVLPTEPIPPGAPGSNAPASAPVQAQPANMNAVYSASTAPGNVQVP